MNEAVKLAKVLYLIYQAQARWMLSQLDFADLVADRPLPDLTSWLPRMVETVKPLLLTAWQAGMMRSALGTAGGVNLREPPDQDRHILTGAGGAPFDVASARDITTDGGR